MFPCEIPISRREQQFYSRFPDLDTALVGTTAIGQGYAHLVREYGRNEVLKVPRKALMEMLGSNWLGQFRNKRLKPLPHASQIEQEIQLFRECFPELRLADNTILTPNDGNRGYLQVWEHVRGRPISHEMLQAGHAVQSQLQNLVDANNAAMRSHLCIDLGVAPEKEGDVGIENILVDATDQLVCIDPEIFRNKGVLGQQASVKNNLQKLREIGLNPMSY